MNDIKDHFLKALKFRPNFSEAHLQLALIYQHNNDNKNAIKHFQAAIISDKQEAEKLEKKADELIKKHQFQNAKEKFIKSEKKIIHYSNVYYSLANHYLNCGKRKLAQVNLKACLKINPKLAKAHRDLGIIFFIEKKKWMKLAYL